MRPQILGAKARRTAPWLQVRGQMPAFRFQRFHFSDVTREDLRCRLVLRGATCREGPAESRCAHRHAGHFQKERRRERRERRAIARLAWLVWPAG